RRLFVVAVGDGFEPTLLQEQAGQAADRRPNIDDIAQESVQRAILSIVGASGRSIEREALLQAAMKELGFLRLKRRIRARLNRGIGGLVRAGKLGTDWNTVWLVQQSSTPLPETASKAPGEEPVQ